ncbi:MAG: hypothetical protein K940chlam3_01661, partial [Chlamydiae bacterium]|nr:hypothetical protein [Chlamydiota bacterium]
NGILNKIKLESFFEKEMGSVMTDPIVNL